MKRSLFLLFSILLLCACARPSAMSDMPPVLPSTKTCTVFIRTPETQITAEWRYSSGSVFEITEPAELRGLRISCNNEGTDAALEDMTVPFSHESVFSMLDAAYGTLLSSNIEPICEQDVWKYDVSANGFIAAQSAIDGELLSIDFPKNDIHVSFARS